MTEVTLLPLSGLQVNLFEAMRFEFTAELIMYIGNSNIFAGVSLFVGAFVFILYHSLLTIQFSFAFPNLIKSPQSFVGENSFSTGNPTLIFLFQI